MSRRVLVLLVLFLPFGVVARAQVHRYFNPGTVWTVSGIRVTAGMDQAYLQYLDGQFKKDEDAQVKAGYMKSYKILQTFDTDVNSWNLLILREYPSLAALEANEEKSDALTRQNLGDDQTMMKGYEDRSKIRELLWAKTAREVLLK
jgi:hypothetical protein